jgi:hypothetical protein
MQKAPLQTRPKTQAWGRSLNAQKHLWISGFRSFETDF